VYCKIKRYKKTRISSLQKKYFTKMYRIGKLKKRPYSQAWKYRDDIRKFEKLQKQYLFLNKYEVTNVVELAAKQLSFMDKKKEVSSERSCIYKGRARFKPLFNKFVQIENLEAAANSYLNGDDIFKEEYEQYEKLKLELKTERYFVEEIRQLKEQFKEELLLLSEKDKAVKKELSIANGLMREGVVA